MCGQEVKEWARCDDYHVKHGGNDSDQIYYYNLNLLVCSSFDENAFGQSSPPPKKRPKAKG
jgi:hypothetical protein